MIRRNPRLNIIKTSNIQKEKFVYRRGSTMAKILTRAKHAPIPSVSPPPPSVVSPSINIGNPPVLSDASLKTLIFCTGWSPENWKLYERWLNHIRQSKLQCNQIIIPDDGSPTLPDFQDCQIITGDLPESQPNSNTVIYHWPIHLGRPSHLNYPGWFRSFMFIPSYVAKYGFKKVIHIEVDAYLTSERIQNYANHIADGWVTFWCPKHNFAEPAIQIIAGSALDNYCQLSKLPYELFINKHAEDYLPFTFINKEFIGDRYGEYLPKVPAHADYAGQIHLEHSL
jgi:hypothetical protein